MDDESRIILGAVGAIAVLLVLYALQPKKESKEASLQPNQSPGTGASFENDKRATLTVGGGLLGGVVGFLLAHYYPLWGGMAMMMGEPFSPARSSLVPGHVVVFFLVFGGIGYAIGNNMNPKVK